jgi:TonB-linked SusC/RagA family outer membrane protein
MKKLSLLLVMFFAVIGSIVAQRTVTGKVTDAKGEPLIGANVLAKGTSAGAATDVDGAYRLSVPAGSSTLVVSYAGYETQEVALGASNVVDVALAENTKVLGEVVVTALGIQREKKSLGYSATDVKSEDIVQRSESDPIRTLSSKVPGVIIQGGGGGPGQSTKMNIRGFSSLTGNTQPLFVVDGIPFDNSVNGTTQTQGTQFSNRAFDLDPNNIEAITVLKGAAASALYGSRAANGVVLVTTKTGKKNRKGLEVTYNSSYSSEKIASLPNFQDVYTQGSNGNYSGGFIGNWGKPFPTEVDRINKELGYDRYDKKYNDGGYTGYADGYGPHPMVGNNYTKARFQTVFPELLEDDPNKPGTKRPVGVYIKPWNFLNDFFQTGSLMENSLTFNAGGDNTGLSATVSRMDNTGIVPNSKANRTTISLGGNAKLANGISIVGNVNYTNTNQSTPPASPSYFTDYGGQGDASIFSRLFYLPRNYNLMNYPFENPNTGDNVFYRALDNPLWLVKYSRFNSKVNRAYGNLTLSYDVTKWLTLTAKGGVNTYTDASSYRQRSGGVFDPNGRLWNYDVTRSEVDMNYFATIKADITSDLDFRLIGGVNANQRSRSNRFVDGDGIFTDAVITQQATSTQLVREDSRYLQRFYGAYADAQFGYKNFLYLGITARNDWTSTLPKGQNSYFYPSVNTALVISDIPSIKMPAFVSFAKVRASYAVVGNEADPYQVATTYLLSQPFVNISGTKINRATLSDRLKNANLKNELTKEIELGTDLRFFKNRIGIDFTWYKRNSFNQITAAALPRSTGFEVGVVNVGEVQNKGIEVGLSLSPIKSDNGFNWNMNVNFTKNASLIVDSGEGDIVFGPSDTYVGGTIHRTGNPYGQIFGTRNARDANGNLQIDRSTGKPIALPTNELIGDPNAKFIAGLINNFSYKGFSLNVLFDWKQGGSIYSATAASLILRGQLGWQTDREGLRVIPGTYADPTKYDSNTKQYTPIVEGGAPQRNTTTISAFQYHFSDGFGAYGTAETNVYDATTFRLREITFGYSFPKKWLQKSPLGNLRVSLSGRNLWFLAPNMLKDLNLDPEVLTENAGSNVQGFEFGAFPTTRRFGVNLYATF